MECLFYGGSKGSFFEFDDFEGIRTIPLPTYPPEFYRMIKNKNFKSQKMADNKIRFISIDVAVASSTRSAHNDASVYTIFELECLSSNKFNRNIIYMETLTGGHTEKQAKRIKQLFIDYECSYIVLDTKGVGYGVYDMLCVQTFDSERQVQQKAYKSFNNEEHADRCIDSTAEAVIFSIVGSPNFNSRIASDLKNDLISKKIKTLVDESTGKAILEEIEGYNELTIEEKVLLNLPYVQIRKMINECVNLINHGDKTMIKLKEQGSDRKDRYSSIAYGNHFCKVLEKELRQDDSNPLKDIDEWSKLWS